MWIGLEPRKRRQHNTTKRGLNLLKWKLKQPISSIVKPKLIAPVKSSNEQIVGVSCEEVHNVESGHPASKAETLLQISFERWSSWPETRHHPNADKADNRSCEICHK